MTTVKRPVWLCLAVVAGCALPARGSAQRLSQLISDLFIFGPGQEALFLAGSATSTNPTSLQAHGRHYIPSSSAENGSVIGFVTGALAAQVANIPVGATSSGETFRFEGGVPISTSTSAGPTFAERAQTLGRGRVLVGVNRTNLTFKSLRGVPLNDIRLVFTHENVDFPGCSEAQGNDCKKMGVPVLENDLMQFNLALDLNVSVTSFFLTYGLTNKVDLGVMLPLVRNTISGSSHAQIIPFGGPTAAHFFSGTSADPVLEASRTSSGSAFGLGDIALRLKVNGRQTSTGGVGFLLDARLPTGDEKDFFGSGSFSGRALAIVSSTIGAVSPHLNVGYRYSGGDNRNDMVLATVGLDHLISRGVTMAAEIVGEFQVGDSRLKLPRPVNYDAPFHRVVNTTAIPDIRDDLINGSFGVKYSAANRMTVVANALVPLNDGGLRARVTYTMGLSYAY